MPRNTYLLKVTPLIFLAALSCNDWTSPETHWNIRARTYLHSIYEQQLTYYQEHGAYARTFEELKWQPFATNDYAFYLTEQSVINTYDNRVFSLPYCVKPFVEKDRFLVIAAGRFRNRNKVNYWSINERGQIENIQCE